MKLALVHYAAAPVIGGVERVMDEHARLFVAHGHEVTIFCQRGGVESPGIRVVHLSDELPDSLSEHDIVFIHNVLTMPFSMPLTEALCRFIETPRKTRVIAWTHDVAAANPDLAPMPRRVPDGVEFVAVSELRRRQLRDALGVEKCRVIPNGIDPARVLGLAPAVADLAEKRGLLDGRLIFIHPTRLLRRKNVEFGIQLVRSLGDATLIVTGAEDPHNPASKAYAEQLRALARDETIFAADHFPVGDAELASLYRLADAMVFPSHQEGFGLPMLEARLHRLPIVYSPIEPLTELASDLAFPITHGEPPDRLRAWLAAHPLHRDRAAVMQEFSWRAVYEKHLVPLLDAAPYSPDN